MSFQTCMLFFLPWYTKDDILKKISAVFVCTTKEVQKHWTPLSFIVKEKDIERERERFQNTSFCFPMNKNSPTVLEQHEGEYIFCVCVWGGGGWTTPLRSDHSLKTSHDYMLSIGQLCVCTCALSLSFTFFVCISLLFSVWKSSWHFTNMHICCAMCCSKCMSTFLRMCQSLCVSVCVSYPLTCLSVLFCVFGCVSDTALPLMSWVWRWDGLSGRRRVLVWERVNE